MPQVRPSEKKKPVHQLGGFKGFLLDSFLGGFSAAISKTVCAPIERVKLVMQTQMMMQTKRNLDPNAQSYTGIVDCFTKIYQNEGMRYF